MLIRRFCLALALASAWPEMAAAADAASSCAEALRQVREALAIDQDLDDEARATVEGLLRDAAQAQKAGEAEVCNEMMEDAKELLGLDSED